MKMFYNYILCNSVDGTTYNGYTVDLDKRLRQHNGELAGGARSTKKRQGHWRYLEVIGSEHFTKEIAMSFEWWLRYPTGKKPRPAHFSGKNGRLAGLKHVMDMEKFKNMKFDIQIFND